MTNEEFNAAVNADIQVILEREKNLLQDAAMEYGRAIATYESARLQRLPERFYVQLQENVDDALDNLKDAARWHFNDHDEFGGA